MNAIETTDLHYNFGGQRVLAGIDLAVPEGSIYGFLGPNGAGKSTTLRLLLGLLRPQRGAVRIGGRPMPRARRHILREVGSLIEHPSLYDHLSAAENLGVWRAIHRCPAQRVRDVLALVGLADCGRKPVRAFSLGMRQRLGVAIALLHAPRVLILDEPTNGLDPNGMIDMRALLLQLNREHGTTVLVSSHLLSEIDKLATHVGLLSAGRLMYQGSLSALRQRERRARALLVRTDDNAAAWRHLQVRYPEARLVDDAVALPPLPPHAAAAVNRELQALGYAVHELYLERDDLEATFLELVRRDA